MVFIPFTILLRVILLRSRIMLQFATKLPGNPPQKKQFYASFAYAIIHLYRRVLIIVYVPYRFCCVLINAVYYYNVKITGPGGSSNFCKHCLLPHYQLPIHSASRIAYHTD